LQNEENKKEPKSFGHDSPRNLIPFPRLGCPNET